MPVGHPDFTQPPPSLLERAVKIPPTTVAPGETKTVFTMEGPGVIRRTILAVSDSRLHVYIYTDGELFDDFTPDKLFRYGYGPSTPGIRLLRYWPQGACIIIYEVGLEFREELRIDLENPTEEEASGGASGAAGGGGGAPLDEVVTA